MKNKKSAKPKKPVVNKIEPFWETKSLSEMSKAEWESLCDGCAKCCLHKFIDDENTSDEIELMPTDHLREGEQMVYSNIVCHLLNDKTCNCTQYAKRTELVPDCVQLTQDNLADIFFMPPSCAYRRINEGKGLPSWHPLLNNNKKSAMHKADMSVRGKVFKDSDVDIEFFEDHIVTWPLNDCD